MPLRYSRCRRPITITSVSHTSSYIWISDAQLALAFNDFVRHIQKRHGSNVPGPLEAQRRLSKRRIGGLRNHVPASVDIGALFGPQWLKGESKARSRSIGPGDCDASSRVVPRESAGHYKAATKRYATEPGPIFMALFGPKESNSKNRSESAQEIHFAQRVISTSSTVRRLLDNYAPIDEVMECLGSTTTVDVQATIHLDFLRFTSKRSISDKQYATYIKNIRRGLSLGTIEMAELHQILDVLKPWLQSRWPEGNKHHEILATTLQAIYDGAEECRIQQFDAIALSKMRSLLDQITDVLGAKALRFQIYRKIWPCPDPCEPTVESHILYWLTQVKHSEAQPQPIEDQRAFSRLYLEQAIEYLCEKHYVQDERTNTTDRPTGATTNPITALTLQLCANTRPFLSRQSPFSTFENVDNHDLRMAWFNLLVNSPFFRYGIEKAVTYQRCKGQPAYDCPRLWYDFFEITTRYLPLDTILALLPDLGAITYCRLLSIFSFGPTATGGRLALSNNLPDSRAHHMHQKLTSSFEKQCAIIPHQPGETFNFTVFATYISSRVVAGIRNEKQTFLVASQRITRLILKAYGETAAFRFMVSMPLRDVISAHAPTRQLEILLQLAAEIYPTQSEEIKCDEFVKNVWIHVKDLILQAGPRWHDIDKNRSIDIIRSPHIRSSYNHLLSTVAVLAAKDHDISDRSSWQIVHWLTRGLQQHGLKLDNDVRHAIVVSALTRPLSKSRVPPSARIKYVLNTLQNSGLDKGMISKVATLLTEWRSAIQQTQQWHVIEPIKACDPPMQGSCYVQHLPFVDEISAIANARLAGRADAILLRKPRDPGQDEHAAGDIGSLDVEALPKSAPTPCALLALRNTADPLIEENSKIRLIEHVRRVGDSNILRPHVTRFAQVAQHNLKLGRIEHLQRRLE